MIWVLAAFLVLPFIEIAGFDLVGQAIGLFPTLALIMLSILGGITLLRFQGRGILRQVRNEVKKGVNPGRELIRATILAIAAILLIIPGFFSDLIAILFFIPGIADFVWVKIRPDFRYAEFSDRNGFTFRNDQTESEAEFRSHDVVDLDQDEYRRNGSAQSPWKNLPKNE